MSEKLYNTACPIHGNKCIVAYEIDCDWRDKKKRNKRRRNIGKKQINDELKEMNNEETN